MNRYHFLSRQEIFEALSNLNNAFLAAKNGGEVEEIINGLLTEDEKIKLGRRIIIASLLHSEMKVREVSQISRVGLTTINLVAQKLNNHPMCYELINNRKRKVEKEYKTRKYKLSGGSKLVHKKKVYTGFKRKDVKR